MKPTRVCKLLIVDGSPLFRAGLTTLLAREPGLQVLPGAANTVEAREVVIDSQPDVILLDLDLPGGSALEFLRKLRAHYPVPTLISTRMARPRSQAALRAIEIGALDVVTKPPHRDRTGLTQFAQRLATQARQAHEHARPVPPPRVQRQPLLASWRAGGLDPARTVVAIGASTGGTEAIRALLAAAPPDFPPVIVTQHMPPGFTKNFAERLNQYSRLRVREAEEGEPLTPGCALIARGDTHLTLGGRPGSFVARYTDQTLRHGHCPSVDVLFESVAAAAGPLAIGILLTGMGRDGAAGLLQLHQRGGLTLAQNRETCVVFGMPKAAIDLGAADEIGPPARLPQLAHQLILRRRRPQPTSA